MPIRLGLGLQSRGGKKPAAEGMSLLSSEETATGASGPMALDETATPKPTLLSRMFGLFRRAA